MGTLIGPLAPQSAPQLGTPIRTPFQPLTPWQSSLAAQRVLAIIIIITAAASSALSHVNDRGAQTWSLSYHNKLFVY